MTSIDDWKPEVGMEVFLGPLPQHTVAPKTGRITKVGRVCFYVGSGVIKECFYIDSKNHNDRRYVQYHCYRSEDDYKRKLEIENKRRKVYASIDLLTDEQIKQVYEMITTNTDKK